MVKAIFRGSDFVSEEQFIYRAGRLQSPLKLSLRASQAQPRVDRAFDGVG